MKADCSGDDEGGESPKSSDHYQKKAHVNPALVSIDPPPDIGNIIFITKKQNNFIKSKGERKICDQTKRFETFGHLNGRGIVNFDVPWDDTYLV